ncbi:MAG: hypothetical protein HFJ94_02445 [Muribaculaceae bacterium]|nr:hypothetical protein [Muribaculaceae bacterium]
MKFNKILLVLALALFGLGACTDEVKYDPAQPEANVEAYFPAALGTSVSLDNDQNQFTVPVYRTSKSGAQTIALSATSTDNLFTVASAVTFADGSDEALVPVDFDFSSIEANKSYSVTITIDDAATTPYGKRTQTFAIKYAPWSAWKVMNGYAQWTTPFNGGTFEVSIAQRSNLLDPNQIQVRTVGYKDDPDGLKGIAAWDNPIVYDIDLSTGIVSLPLTDTGEAYSGGGTIWECDLYNYYKYFKTPNGESRDEYKDACTFNSETGVLTIEMGYFVVNSGTILGSYGTFTEFIQLPGYPDYSMYFANNGSVITEQGKEFAVLTIAKGSDVNGFALKLVPGYLSEEEIAEVADDMKAEEELTLYYDGGDFQFPIAEDGDQTLVALTYDAMGNYLNTQSYHFYYEVQQKDWNAGWTPLADKLLYTDYFNFSKPESWEVEVQESNKYPGYYRIVKPYAEVIDPSELERGHYYIYFDGSNPDQAYVELSYTSLGHYFASEAYMLLAYGGATEADVTAAGMWGTWKDNTLTMPKQSIGWVGALSAGKWLYYTGSMNASEIKLLQPIPAADEDEPGLGEEAFKAVAKKQIATGSNAMPVKNAKKNRKLNTSAPLI